jgi:hypothetical protein
MVKAMMALVIVAVVVAVMATAMMGGMGTRLMEDDPQGSITRSLSSDSSYISIWFQVQRLRLVAASKGSMQGAPQAQGAGSMVREQRGKVAELMTRGGDVYMMK